MSSKSQSKEDKILSLLGSPFASQLYSASILSALTLYGSCTVLTLATFCFFRSKYPGIYQRKKSVDDNFIGMCRRLKETKRDVLTTETGLDAVEYLNTTQTVSFIMTGLTVLSFGLLAPINVRFSSSSLASDVSILSRLTPQFLRDTPAMWAYVVASYLGNGLVIALLWSNSWRMVRTKAKHFGSASYHSTIQARVLLIMYVPRRYQSDLGLRALLNADAATLGRNITALERDMAILEKRVAKCKEVTRIPCRSKDCDKDVARHQNLRSTRREVQSQRLQPFPPASYGFVSYRTVQKAHETACQHYHRGPEGTMVQLAPDPGDIIWDNLTMTKPQRLRSSKIIGLGFALLTVLWILPNVFIAVFLSNVSHLGLLWPRFHGVLRAQPALWGVLQGTIPPIMTSVFYYALPWILSRLCSEAGDICKSGRSRHVSSRLFIFYFFNHVLVLSIFAAVWGYITLVIDAGRSRQTQAILITWYPQLIAALVLTTPYWCCWLVQRLFMATLDLIQPILLIRHWLLQLRKGGPSIVDTAVPFFFDYTTYYAHSLLYASVALCFGFIQPLILAVTAAYFWLDYYTKKYMIIYMTITKHEAYAVCWPIICNHIVAYTALGNAVVGLLIVSYGNEQKWIMLGTVLPLLLALGAFKWYSSTYLHLWALHSSGTRQSSEMVTPCRGKEELEKFKHPVLIKSLPEI